MPRHNQPGGIIPAKLIPHPDNEHLMHMFALCRLAIGDWRLAIDDWSRLENEGPRMQEQHSAALHPQASLVTYHWSRKT